MAPADFDSNRPFVNGPCSLRLQTVLFDTKLDEVDQALASIERAAEIAVEQGYISRVEVAYGDSSRGPTVDAERLDSWQKGYPALAAISYRYFGANLGSAGGQNRLLEDAVTDLVLFTNPDVRFSPVSLAELVKPFRSAGVGATEARQLPIEHPKHFDPKTGETSWAAGACMMVPASLAKALGGFDAASFFLYCDDVDLSWRIRDLGFKVIHQPSAGVFHDKRLTPHGELAPSDTEEFYSAEARLILAHKYGRPDIVAAGLSQCEASGNANLQRAAAAYRLRREQGRLPAQLDSDVAEFVGDNFARHRFAL